MTIKLETRGLGKRYGSTQALEPTDLQVREGEFLTLLGPSGSGKTTLLQMIAGLAEPSCGHLYIDGAEATYLPPGKRGIGLVFQSYALFPHLTVAENVAYPLRMRRVRGVDMQRAVSSALSMVKMDAYGQRYPRELSGGQQQRVALARCFVYRPSVVLLDEPLGALDKKLREHMQVEIRRLHQELGLTFIYVTHDQEEALTMSDRICLMNQAKVEQVGAPRELYDEPATRFAADFLGHSNLLDGETDGQDAFFWLGRRLPAPPRSRRHGKATLLIRPEVARLAPPGEGWMRGVVSEVVFIGSDLQVTVELAPDACFSIRCPRDAAPAVGQEVGVAWDPGRSVLLPA